MHRPKPFHIAIAAVALAAGIAGAAAAAAGSAGTATAWSRISGPTQPGVQLGLARTSDGVLHVIWNRGATNTSIFETRFSAAGRSARHLGGRQRLGQQRRARARRHARPDLASVRRRHGRHPDVDGAPCREELDPAAGRSLGRRGRGGVRHHRRDADEGRSAGHGLARHRRGRRPSRLDSAERLPGRHDRVVPGHRRGNRRSRPLGRDERRARRRLRPADPAERRAARPDAAPGQGLERQLERPNRDEPASSWRTRTASQCASRATAGVRRRSRPARTSAQPSAPVLRGDSGSPGATRATVSTSPGRTAPPGPSSPCRSSAARRAPASPSSSAKARPDRRICSPTTEPASGTRTCSRDSPFMRPCQKAGAR